MNRYELAARLTLADLDGFAGRMPAARQRTLFGWVPFGKARVSISCSGQGLATATRVICFGTDTTWTDFTFAELAREPGTRYAE